MSETPESCPKCGSTKFDGPRFKAELDWHSEWLEFECSRCGYYLRIRPLDWTPLKETAYEQFLETFLSPTESPEGKAK